MKQKYELLISNEAALDTVRKKFGSEPKRTYPHNDGALRHFYDVTISGISDIWVTARDLMAIDGVIEVDPILKLLGIIDEWRDNDDINLDTFWHHTMTGFPEAVQLAKKKGKLSANPGNRIQVAHLDTGYTLHPEILGIQSARGRNFIRGEDAGSALDRLGRDFLEQPGHGTSTASVIIGEREDEKDRSAGVYPYVDLIPYRISESVVHIFDSPMPEAIQHAVDSGCSVITMSMGGAPGLCSWEKAIDNAYSKGVIFVAAAGNLVNFVVWPARYPKVIAVAAVNTHGLEWEGSCSGPKVDISAPGENVYVASVEQAKETREQVYLHRHGSGTSFATPHVAAAAALYLEYYREELNADDFREDPPNIVEAFRYALNKGAFVPNKWDVHKFGAGILNVPGLLRIPPQEYIDSKSRIQEKSIESAQRDTQKNLQPSLEEKKEIFEVFNSFIDDGEARSSSSSYDEKSFRVSSTEKGAPLMPKINPAAARAGAQRLEKLSNGRW